MSKAVVSGSTRYYTYNTLNQLTSYNGNTYTYDGMGNRASRNSQAYKCAYSYTRGNLIKEVAVTLGDNVPLIGGLTVKTQYYYNCNGVRYKKVSNGETTTYYLDGEKILGEDRKDSNGNITARLRYFYDIDGLCGVRYNDATYKYVRNAYGDIVMLTSNGLPEAVYYYDAWGNCKVYDVDGNENTSSDFIGNINPFRWKGHYFDTESGLYYANGSYYDPEVGQHVDAMPVSSLIENAFKVFGLDLNGLMCDNILAYLPCVYSIFTTLELSPDPLYDKDANKPWWELAWNAIVECIAGIVNWYNNIDIGIKIGVGLGLFIVSCVLNCITNGAWSVVELSLRYIIGVLSATAVSVFFAALSGQSLDAAAAYGFVDAVFLGGIFEFVSAGINALKVGIRSIKSTAPQPVIKDGVEIRHAQYSDFTDEAWEKINNISHDANGNTISSLSEGNAIHKGFMVGQRGSVAGGGLKGGRGYFDGFDDFNKIIYELKPNNPASINKGIAQLKRYQNVMIAQGKGSYKLVLVLY